LQPPAQSQFRAPIIVRIVHRWDPTRSRVGYQRTRFRLLIKLEPVHRSHESTDGIAEYQHHTHTTEIQDVKCHLANNVLTIFTVDQQGTSLVSQQIHGSTEFKVSTHRFPSFRGLEGWGGVTFSPVDPLEFVTTAFWSNSANCYKDGQLYRSFQTLERPTAINLQQDQNVIVIAEGGFMSLWDARQSERGGNIRRLFNTTSQPLYAIGTRADVICAGGEARNVSFFDCKTWNLRSTWKNCTKFDITGLDFSPGCDQCYVSDDSVIHCNFWTQGDMDSTTFNYFGGVRFDSRLLGICCHPLKNIVVGLSQNGTVYHIRNLHKLTPNKAIKIEETERKKKKPKLTGITLDSVS